MVVVFVVNKEVVVIKSTEFELKAWGLLALWLSFMVGLGPMMVSSESTFLVVGAIVLLIALARYTYSVFKAWELWRKETAKTAEEKK